MQSLPFAFALMAIAELALDRHRLAVPLVGLVQLFIVELIERDFLVAGFGLCLVNVVHLEQWDGKTILD